jgi:hypothetical protein
VALEDAVDAAAMLARSGRAVEPAEFAPELFA